MERIKELQTPIDRLQSKSAQKVNSCKMQDQNCYYRKYLNILDL